jgi:hypothetical protein
MAEDLSVAGITMTDDQGTGTCSRCGAQCLGREDSCHTEIDGEPVCHTCSESGAPSGSVTSDG